MTETRTEWATELTWPDGHTEYRSHGDRRRAGELSVDSINTDDCSDAVAVLVGRPVTVGAWTPVPRASVVGVTI